MIEEQKRAQTDTLVQPRGTRRFSPTHRMERWIPVILSILAVLLMATLAIILMAALGIKL